MQAYDVERSSPDGRGCVEALFEFILENAGKMEAHEAEKAAFKMIASPRVGRDEDVLRQARYGRRGTHRGARERGGPGAREEAPGA